MTKLPPLPPHPFDMAIRFRDYHYHRKLNDLSGEPILSRAVVDESYYQIMTKEAGDIFSLRLQAKLRYIWARVTGWYYWDSLKHNDADKSPRT